MKNDCVFCEKIANGDYDGSDSGCVFFEPLNPVVPGHLLVVPERHVKDFSDDPWTSANAMLVAAKIAHDCYSEYNIITSKGTAATQSVMHLHVHIVPRLEGDGLHLPWTNQRRSAIMDNPNVVKVTSAQVAAAKVMVERAEAGKGPKPSPAVIAIANAKRRGGGR